MNLKNIKKNIRSIARPEIQRELERQHKEGYLAEGLYRTYLKAIAMVKKEDNMT